MSILGCNCTKNKTEHREEIIISKAVNVAKPDLAITCFADCACGEVVTRLPYEFLVDLVKQYPIEQYPLFCSLGLLLYPFHDEISQSDDTCKQ